jgi:hypothetical protein
MTMEKITFQVDRTEKKVIAQSAKDRHMSVSEFIRVATKEKIDAQSTILPLVEDMRADFSAKLTESDRVLKTSLLLSQSTQDKFNHQFNIDLRKGLAEELDAHLKFTDESLRKNFSKSLQSSNAVATMLAEIHKKLDVFTQMEKNNYERLKALEKLMKDQTEGKWWKRD